MLSFKKYLFTKQTDRYSHVYKMFKYSRDKYEKTFNTKNIVAIKDQNTNSIKRIISIITWNQ